MELVTSITLNREERRFVVAENFFPLFPDADPDKVLNSFNNVLNSMEFDEPQDQTADYTVQPVPTPEFDDSSEPIYNYHAVQRVNERTFTILHRTQKAKNIYATLNVDADGAI